MESFEFKDELSTEIKITDNERKDFFTIFKENKTVFYSIIFYAAGLLCGSFAYKKCQNEVLNSILNASDESFLQIFLNNLSLYMLIFTVSVLLAVCLVGFPLINLIPLFVGFTAGLKVGYYYAFYGVKGIGYSLLMVAPFICLFLTVIIYSVSMSYEMSRKIYEIAIKKTDIAEGLNYKLYLKKFLIYGVLVVAVALINAAICTALGGIITI